MALITINESARMLNRPVRTVRDWVKTGVLKAHQVKNMTYVDSNTIEALKDTEADIDYALSERKAELERIKDDLKNIRLREDYDKEPMRTTVKEMVYALDVLNEREKRVFTDILEDVKIDTIGENFGLTRERIRQIFYKAQNKVSNAIRSYRRMLNEQVSLRGEIEVLRSQLKQQETYIANYRRQLSLPEEERKSDEENRLLNTQLKNYDLSVRAMNCLKAADIDTVGQLTDIRREELLKFRNFGKKTLEELDEFLHKHGLQWGKGYLVQKRNKRGLLTYEVVLDSNM